MDLTLLTCLLLIIPASFTVSTNNFICNTPISWVGLDVVTAIPALKSVNPACHRVSVEYNSSHVTVHSDCDKLHGTLYSVRENEVTKVYSSPPIPLSTLDRTTVIKTEMTDPNVYYVVKVITDSGSTLLTGNVTVDRVEDHVRININSNLRSDSKSVQVIGYKDIPTFLKRYKDCRSLHIGLADDELCSIKSTLPVETRRKRQSPQRLQFDQNPYEDTYPEDMPSEVPIMTVSASHSEDPARTITYYLIRNSFGSSRFEIDPSTGMIQLMSSLDYEENKVIRLSVLAESDTYERAVTEVILNVEDANDEYPTFVRDEYLISVLDRTPIGSDIGSVTAVDADSGMFGQIVYSVVEGADSSSFDVNRNSGEINIRNSLHEKAMYSFVIEARDRGSPPLMSNVTVTVFVQNTTIPGAAPPRFVERSYTARIAELGRAGRQVTKVRALPYSPLQYSIIQGSTAAQNSPRCFEIDPTTGSVTTNRYCMLDYDGDTPVFNLVVKLRTTQLPSFEDYAEVTVHLTDMNDNAPVFSQNVYKASVLENVPSGSYITTVTATDKDSGPNGEIKYSFGSGDTDGFRIDSVLGHIYSGSPLDREKTSSYTFFVLATDKGQVSQSSGTRVEVSVLDVNDCKPVFRSPVMEVYVREDAQIGDLVTTLTSVDQDEDKNADVTYAFISGDTTEFTLYADTGIVRVNTELDYETLQEYSIRVQATDGKFFDEAELVIKVEDVNDHTPMFGSDEYPITVREDVQPGTPLLQITATDGDTGSDQAIRYNIVPSDTGDEVPFSIDEVEGWFSVSAPLDREETANYNIRVSAADIGGLTSYVQVMVTIQDINDNAPLCQPPMSGTVRENSPAGSHVLTVNATDRDAGENAMLSFRLLSHQDVFSINSTSGHVTVLTSVDREETPEVTLVVEVSDRGRTKQQASECTYVIKVEDENDNSPVFSQLAYSVELSELSEVGTVFFRLDCEDQDSGVNGELDYTISGGNVPPLFDINSRTGELLVIGTLDYKTKSQYMLLISVTDRAPPYHESSTKVEVNLIDANDNPPVFDREKYVVNIPEDLTPGMTIVTITATDEDTNQTLTFSIENTHENTFSMDSAGDLVLMKYLDREKREEYLINVTVSDNGDPVLSSTTTISVTVTDVNDNPPRLTVSQFSLSTSLDADPGTELLKLSINDEDGPGNGAPFTSEILSAAGGRKAFGIENNILKVLKPRTLSPNKEYTLNVQISDSGSPPLTSEATIIISVLPTNTYPPVAAPAQVNLPLFDRDVRCQTVLEYSAQDSDPGTVLVYSLSESDPQFWMFPNGTLMTSQRPTIGTHRLTVYISDGKHREISTITVQVYSLNSPAAANPLTVRLDAVNERTFNQELFISIVGEILRTSPTEIIVLSAQDKLSTSRKRAAQQGLEVTLIARGSGGEYMSVDDMKKLMSRDLVLFQERTGYILDTIDLDPCLREPCPMSSTCTSTTSYTIHNDKISAVTTPQCKCGEGLEGSRCDIKIPCYTNPCNTGSCHVTGGTEKCVCDENWSGAHCDIPVRHCLNSPCLYGGSCRDETVGYTCTCQNGYKGQNCEIVILSEDHCARASCSRHSTCTSGRDDVTCTCMDGWGGQFCTYVNENPTDPCSKNPCKHGGKCVSESADGFTCECSAGFTGPSCEENIDDCSGVTCLHGGNCVDGIDGYVCECENGYSGSNCQRTAQPCDSNPCQNGGFCYNINGEHLCHCATGYVGDACEIPLVSPGYCDSSPCTEHADYCTAGLLGYTCTCALTWRGKNCEISDRTAADCDLNPCINGGTCISQSQAGSYLPYTCQCEPGFTGYNCEKNVNECSADKCLNGGTCIDRTNTYECLCQSGFSGRNCQVTEDPCLSLPCRNGGKCYSLEDSYVCQCTSSFTGRNCEERLNFCPENHCRNGGKCGVRRDGSLKCSCRAEYHGEYCQFRYRHCTPDTCHNGGTCVEGVGGYRCQCPTGYNGPECQIIEVGVLEGGHVAVPSPSLKSTSISFKIRTRSSNGLLMYAGRYGGGKDYLIAQLVDERILIRFSVGSDQPVRLQLNKRVSDRKWHILTVSVKSKQVSAVVDECHDSERGGRTSCSASAAVSGAYYSLDTNTPLYLGGVDYNYPFLPQSTYHGCIKDLYIGGELVDFSQTIPTSRHYVGCMEQDCKTSCSGQKVCTLYGGVVTCQCPWGKTGDCSTSAPSTSLSNSVPLTLTLTSSYYLNSATLMISLQIRTRIPDCLLYVFGSPGEGEHYLIVELSEGQPTVTINTGKTTKLTLYGTRVNDGTWHTLLFNKVLDQIELRLDEMYSAVNRTTDGQTQFRTSSRAVLSVGGVSGGVVVAERVGSGVIGCVRDVRVGNLEVDLFANGGSDIQLGCEVPPTCVHSTCPASHRCKDIWGDYTCECPEGFSGPTCDCTAGYTGDTCQYEINECDPNPCVHALSCTDKFNGYSCECKPGYAGMNCDVDINECADLPCQNGGTCVDLVNAFECRCNSQRYTGELCEIDTTPCKDGPCLHQGTCTEYGGGEFGCTCTSSWGGDLCQLPKSCDFDPCVNGKCKGPAKGEVFVTCECDDVWTGPTCEEIDCDTCKNGNCRAGVCTCYPGFSGPSCELEEQEIRSVSAPIQTWVIVLVAVLGVLLVIVIILIVVCRKRCYPDTKYREIPPQGGGTPLHPYYQPPLQSPQFYPDNKLQNYNNMFHYNQFGPHGPPMTPGPGNLVQMSELSQLSTATLDNEIKL